MVVVLLLGTEPRVLSKFGISPLAALYFPQEGLWWAVTQTQSGSTEEVSPLASW